MADNFCKEIEVVVNTLLQVSDCILEISKEHLVTNIWMADDWHFPFPEEKYLGKKIEEIRHNPVISQSAAFVTEVFGTGQKHSFEYNHVSNECLITFFVRTLPIHPDKNHVFLVIEHLHLPKQPNPVEDDWIRALDSASDGVWDIDLAGRGIRFSEKWHRKFGYSASEITTILEWTSILHPADLGNSMKKIEEHLSKKTPFYSAELRILGKDGTYRWVSSRGVFISRGADGRPLRFLGTHTDINEHKIAEEQYRRNALLLSKLVDNLQCGILMTDEQGKIIFANQVFCDIYDVSGPGELTGTDVAEGLKKRKLLFKEHDLFLLKTLETLHKNEILLNEEWEMKDGRIFSRDFIPIALDNNKTGGIWILKDVTEQKNAEKAIDAQRHFYESILNNIPVDIAVHDGEKRFLFANRNAIKDGEIRKWIVGKTNADYARLRNRPDSFTTARDAHFDRAVSEKKTVEMIEPLARRDGNVEYYLRVLNPVYYENGALELLLAYGINITELMLAQENLKTSVDTFSSAFDFSGVGMALLDPDGRLLNVNKALCKLCGYEKEELLELTIMDITHPQDLKTSQVRISQMLKKKITSYTLDKRLISKSQKIVLVSLTVSLVWNSDETPKFFIAQVMDITKKRQLENEILLRNKELEATKANLVNKVSQMEELSNIIAHNLRGPAGNIRLLSGALLAKIKQEMPDDENIIGNSMTEEQAIEFILECSNSLMGSLATLMDITEIKLNKELPYNECNVTEIVEEIMRMQQSVIYEKEAVIKLNLEVNYISYPEAYLESILYNLISNALKYNTPDLPPEITVTTLKKNDKIQIIVKDNGLGIDMQAYGDKVFKLNQVFHQGYDSKGVGLYITKTQVESMGGSITVQSSPGMGCEFVVTL